MNTKHENHEKNHTKAHHHQIVESRDKEKNLKISQRKKGTFRGIKKNMTDFLSEIMQMRRQ